MKTVSGDEVDFFLLSGDPLIYNVLRTCTVIRVAHGHSGRIGWLVTVDPSIPLLDSLGNRLTESLAETTLLAIFGSDREHVPVLAARTPTRVDVYAVTSNSVRNDGVLNEGNSILYPPSLIHQSREQALEYLSPMDERRIREWVARKKLDT